MEIAFVGLGKMGGNMALRLLRAGHQVVGFDLNASAVNRLVTDRLIAASSFESVGGHLRGPRHVWLMVPSGTAVDNAIASVKPGLSEGDVLIDGGNSDYRDTIRRSEALAREGIHFVDVGTSGGIWGLENGYCLMAGGEPHVVQRLAPIFDSLSADGEAGWGHVGPSGAGHFVKMVHNGIEYGMMQAMAEGFAIMEAKKELSLDLHQIAEIWRHGSVVRSWLLDLTSSLLKDDPRLSEIAPYVADSGEGRWTVREAIDLNIAAPVITSSLLQRIQSRDELSFANRVLAGMRKQFGGHAVKQTDV